MARDRSDLRWQHFYAKDQWRERLTWARETHGAYSNKEAFAVAVDEEGPAYRKYERPTASGRNSAKDLPYEKAVKWAAALDVRWQWLLEGEGVPWRDDEPPQYSPEARDLAEAVERLPADQRRAKVEAIKALLTGTGRG